MSSKIEKLKNIFLAAFFFLVITIISTPILVRNEFSLFSEEVLESILLLLQMSAAWRIFRLYQKSIEKREKEIQKITIEYQKREKELLEAFAYLGKVNVQVSLIKSFLQKLKAPSDRKEAEDYINEILRIVLSLSGKKWATLRVIDTKNLKTIKEYWAYSKSISSETEVEGIKIGNKSVVNWNNNDPGNANKLFRVFGSAGSDLSSSRIFLVFQNGKKFEQDIEDFIRAAVNQCEVIFTLFETREAR